MQMIVYLSVLGFSALALVFLSLIQFYWLRAQFKEHLSDRLQSSIQKPLLDIMERVTGQMVRNTAEIKESLDRTLGQNRLELQTGLIQSTKVLEGKFQSLELQVGSKLENIGKSVETKLNENLKEGFKHFEKVQEHLMAAELKLQSLNVVGQSISDLNQLLKLPHLRGGFGEATLERLLADFMPIGSYELQYVIVPGTTERVDAVVKLARQVLPIDSKFPREQILPLFDSADPLALEGARKALVEYMKAQAKTIAAKYIRPEHGTTDMALLFLPSETLYFEVIRNTDLFETLSKLKVFPVSPNTLSISLRSVVMAQEYYDMARGVEQTIEDVKKARRHFEHFEKKFDDLGKGLRKAQEAFETAQTHLGRYESSVFRLTGIAGDKPGLPEDSPLGELSGGTGAVAAGPAQLTLE